MSAAPLFLVASLLMTIGATTVLADPPHRGGLPPGLQMQLDRGESLPPAWRERSGQFSYGRGDDDDDYDDDDDDDDDSYGYSYDRYDRYDSSDSYGYSDQDRYGDGYRSATPYDDQYAPEPVEDTLYRIIQDVSDWTERLSR
jgi:hypothetical protein